VGNVKTRSREGTKARLGFEAVWVMSVEGLELRNGAWYIGW
jgi:hypothetical protein